jgi:hypothetical protein
MKYLCLALPLILCFGCSLPPKTADQSATAASPEARIQQIPAADPQKYAAMKDMKGWRNPYLIIRVDGVALLDARNNEEQTLDPDKLAEALAKLPASAWPCGRVVAIHEIGEAKTDAEKAQLRKNRALVAGTLESLQVAIQWVPAS